MQFEQVSSGASGVEVQQPGDGLAVRLGAGKREQVEQDLFRITTLLTRAITIATSNLVIARTKSGRINARVS